MVTSLPGQITTDHGLTKIGIVVTGNDASRVSVEATRGDSRADATIDGSFRAEDERRVVYWLDEPAEHHLHLALDLVAAVAGQTHVFSVLRRDDHISKPSAIDADTGRPFRRNCSPRARPQSCRMLRPLFHPTLQ